MERIVNLFVRTISRFCTVLGILQVFIFLMNIVYPSGIDFDISEYMLVYLTASLVFTLAYVFIFTDEYSAKLPIPARIGISVLPCAAVCVPIVYFFDWVSLLGLHDGEHSKKAAIFDWYFSFAAIAIFSFLLFLGISTYFRKKGSRYDQALIRYKSRSRERE